jgi:hypothetical protein
MVADLGVVVENPVRYGNLTYGFKGLWLNADD